jgi:hypothetical protein
MHLVWFLANRQQRPDQLAPPGVSAQDTAPAAEADPPGQPLRPPELFGKVEAVRHLEKHGTNILIRSTKPNLAGWDSAQNAYHRSIDMPCWVAIHAGEPGSRRGGGAADLAVGQTVSAWCSGPMYSTDPPQWSGHFVVLEPDNR